LSGTIYQTANEISELGGECIAFQCDHVDDAQVESVFESIAREEQGLIINLSFFAAQRNDKGVAYGAAKAATDHIVACMAEELRKYNVATISLYPGVVRTEAVLILLRA
jgi:short-subunit dehydrogenase